MRLYHQHLHQSHRPGQLWRDRGAVLLETALVLPIFLCLLCFCMDLPRFLAVKQRVIGASRLVAEVRARNSGTIAVSTTQLGAWFFDDPTGAKVALSISKPDPDPKYPLISGAIHSLEDWLEKYLGKAIPSIINFLANLMTGGNLNPYFFNVFSRDLFYGAQVDAKVQTLLPPQAYAQFADAKSFTGLHQVSATTYLPNADSCKYTGESFIAAMLEWLHDHFDL